MIAKPLEGRIHIGKDNDTPPAEGRGPTGRSRLLRSPGGAVDGEARSRPSLSLIGAPAAAIGAAAVLHAGPALAPIVPGLGSALDIEMRRSGAEGVALTFDDGPHSQGTPSMLETLRERDATATFFLAGEQVDRRPGLAAEIVAAGHRVELHCYRHRNLLRLTPREFLEDAERARVAIEEACGQAIADYRPPYGIFSAANLRAVRRRGWRPVLWSRWGKDWTPPGNRRVDRASRQRRHRGRRHRPPARRRLLQRAGLLGAHGGGAAADPR